MPPQRGEAHRGIDAFAVLDRRDGAAVAKVAGDDPGAFKAAVQLAVAGGDVAVAGAVEAIAADGIFFIIFIGDTEHIGFTGHGLVEGGVKDGYHRGPFAENFLTGFHCDSLGRVVERP